jgi:hypothetical protein
VVAKKKKKTGHTQEKFSFSQNIFSSNKKAARENFSCRFVKHSINLYLLEP